MSNHRGLSDHLRTILLVDDEPHVRQVVARMLTRMGFQALGAGSGAEAEETWMGCRREIDLLLTDLQMPGAIDGWELATRLLGRERRLKVLFMTGNREALLAKEPDLIEAVDFIVKPFTLAELEQILRRRFDGPITGV